MEDVWVWDKNRPTRIIPRAEVYTSSDVTVEELRGEGDEPKLTAEALAERIGESLAHRRRRGLARRVLLAVDVGNTQTVFGLYDGETLAEHWRVATEAQPHRRRARRSCSAGCSTWTTVDGSLPLLDGAGARPRVRGVGGALDRRARCSCSGRA